jgi:hypothetical protein
MWDGVNHCVMSRITRVGVGIEQYGSGFFAADRCMTITGADNSNGDLEVFESRSGSSWS